jgi:hypothetical protein
VRALFIFYGKPYQLPQPVTFLESNVFNGRAETNSLQVPVIYINKEA